MTGGVPPAVGIAASVLLTGAGMHMLRVRRRTPPGPYTPMVTTFCMASAAFLVGLTWEWPGGIAVWLGLVGLAGMIAAFRQGSGSRPTKFRGREWRRERTGEDKVWRSFSPLAALSGVLLGGLAASAVALAAAAWLPMVPLDRGFLAIVLWPVLWSTALLWLYAGRRPGLAAFAVGVVALVSGFGVWLAFLGGAPHAS